ncbi:YbjN domain-containing protein [Chryseobacterium aquaticum]|uniref:YbjN domain-containing protein n=1 Tax=Chryseobacterium aquaticum TaxID=452084 RepID=A0A848N8H9_9FLAO|nr:MULTISPECIES: YbjN domain-containing protein [Chryseobacterium]NMR34781.1 YbjN domain-containing protein [Chryseobacterium aquaticum]NRQ46831.1 YbjN domain-containing protein [Chryseobacterium sp. C-204]
MSEKNRIFNKVKHWLLDYEFTISFQDENQKVLIIEKESNGIKNMILVVSDTILIMEQFLFEIKNPTEEIYKILLQKNRDIVHGAFVLDHSGKKVIFRDTLPVDNMAQNEVMASIDSLGILVGEFNSEMIQMTK